MKAVEAISLLALEECSWSPHNSEGWTIFSSNRSRLNSASCESNTSLTTPSSSDDSVKTVRFSTIEVRHFPITIGDSLSCADGVPHTIEWDHLQDQTEKMPVNFYERQRGGRRQGESLVLDSLEREQKLRKVGFTTQDLLDAVRAREVARRTLYC